MIGTRVTTRVTESELGAKGLTTLYLERPAGWQFQPGQYVQVHSSCRIGGRVAPPAILAVASGVNDPYIALTAPRSHNPPDPNHVMKKDAGEEVIVTGPLVRPFPMELITPATDLLLLGGGTGLTPLRSVWRSLPDTDKIKLIYSAKTEKDLPYPEEVETLRRNGHTISLTKEEQEGYATGRITHHLEGIPITDATLAFVCGSIPLIRATLEKLAAIGLPKDRIYVSLPYTAKSGGPIFRADDPVISQVSTGHMVRSLIRDMLT